jgi:protein phosphatase
MMPTGRRLTVAAPPLLGSDNEDQHFGAKVSLGVSHNSPGGLKGDSEAQGWLAAVADGMGGLPCGALASRLAVDVFVAEATAKFPLTKSSSLSPLTLQHFGDAAVGACQSALASEVKRQGNGSLPGTTLTAGIIVWPYLYLFHVGDSRCYLRRDMELKQLTHDHTVYADIIRAGMAADGPLPSSSVVSHSPGSANVDTSVVKLSAGDTLLFCTDGVHSLLSDEVVSAVLAQSAQGSAEQIAQRLVNEALNHGGTDNATAVVVKL